MLIGIPINILSRPPGSSERHLPPKTTLLGNILPLTFLKDETQKYVSARKKIISSKIGEPSPKYFTLLLLIALIAFELSVSSLPTFTQYSSPQLKSYKQSKLIFLKTNYMAPGGKEFKYQKHYRETNKVKIECESEYSKSENYASITRYLSNLWTETQIYFSFSRSLMVPTHRSGQRASTPSASVDTQPSSSFTGTKRKPASSFFDEEISSSKPRPRPRGRPRKYPDSKEAEGIKRRRKKEKEDLQAEACLGLLQLASSPPAPGSQAELQEKVRAQEAKIPRLLPVPKENLEAEDVEPPQVIVSPKQHSDKGNIGVNEEHEVHLHIPEPGDESSEVTIEKVVTAESVQGQHRLPFRVARTKSESAVTVVKSNTVTASISGPGERECSTSITVTTSASGGCSVSVSAAMTSAEERSTASIFVTAPSGSHQFPPCQWGKQTPFGKLPATQTVSTSVQPQTTPAVSTASASGSQPAFPREITTAHYVEFNAQKLTNHIYKLSKIWNLHHATTKSGYIFDLLHISAACKKLIGQQEPLGSLLYLATKLVYDHCLDSNGESCGHENLVLLLRSLDLLVPLNEGRGRLEDTPPASTGNTGSSAVNTGDTSTEPRAKVEGDKFNKVKLHSAQSLLEQCPEITQRQAQITANQTRDGQQQGESRDQPPPCPEKAQGEPPSSEQPQKQEEAEECPLDLSMPSTNIAQCSNQEERVDNATTPDIQSNNKMDEALLVLDEWKPPSPIRAPSPSPGPSSSMSGPNNVSVAWDQPGPSGVNTRPEGHSGYREEISTSQLRERAQERAAHGQSQNITVNEKYLQYVRETRNTGYYSQHYLQETYPKTLPLIPRDACGRFLYQPPLPQLTPLDYYRLNRIMPHLPAESRSQYFWDTQGVNLRLGTFRLDRKAVFINGFLCADHHPFSWKRHNWVIIQWALINLLLTQYARAEHSKSLALKEHFLREINCCRDLLESWLMRGVRAEFLKDHQDMMVCNVSALMDELKRCPGKVKPSWAKNAAPWPHAYPPT